MICNFSLKGDQAYLEHMQKVHGTQSPDQAMAQEKAKENNLPKQTPIPLDPNAPPSPEFMEIANQMDKKNETRLEPAVQPKAEQLAQVASKEPQPIMLKYRYEGTCKKCNIPVRTIVVKANNQTVAVALCLDHGEMKQREVPDLEEPLNILTEDALEMAEHIALHNNAKKTLGLVDPLEELAKKDIELHKEYLRKRVKRKYVRRKPELLDKNALQGKMLNSRMSKSSGENLPSQS